MEFGVAPARVRSVLGEHAAELVVVAGDHVVTARCNGCGAHGNPRYFEGVTLGGRKGAYSGTCAACAGEEGGR